MLDPGNKDDDGDELSELAPLVADEELGGDEFGGGVGMGLDLGDDETIGLDDSEGLGEALDPAQLLDLDDEAEPSWLAGSEASPDFDAGEDLEDEGSEDGWTTDTEAPTDWEDDFDPGGSEDEPLVDEGELGPDDLGGLGRTAPLPPLDAEAEADTFFDASELGFNDSLPPPPRGDDEPAVRMGGTLPGWLSPSRLSVEHGGPVGDGIFTLAAPGSVLVAASDRLYRQQNGRLEEHDVPELSGHEITSLAASSSGERWVAAGTGWGGVFRSLDGGQTFTAVSPLDPGGGSPPACYVAVQSSPKGPCLWARTATGSVFASEDCGESWAPVSVPGRALALTTATNNVHVLCVDDAGAVLASGASAGALTTRRVKSLRPERGRTYYLAALGDAIAIADEDDDAGPLLSIDGGSSFERASALQGLGPVAWAREGERVVLYGGVLLKGRSLLIRHEDGVDTTLLDVLDERAERGLRTRVDSSGQGRVYALLASSDGNSGTELWVATGVGLFKVTVGGAG